VHDRHLQISRHMLSDPGGISVERLSQAICACRETRIIIEEDEIELRQCLRHSKDVRIHGESCRISGLMGGHWKIWCYDTNST